MKFELHPNFSNKIFLLDLPLCRVLLENEQHYPWLILVPRRAAKRCLIDLSMLDQIELTKELDLVQRVLQEQFKGVHLNVAAIGNKTPQLHVHVIGRHEMDPAWPGTVFDHPVRLKYEDKALQQIAQKLIEAINLKRQTTQALERADPRYN